MIQFDELQLALNELETIVVVTDTKGNIRYVNDAFVSKYGYSRKESMGSNLRMIRTDYHDEQFYKNLWKTILSGETWEGIFLNKSKKGRLIWEEAKISPIKKDGKLNGFIAIKDDITYKKELEEQFHKEKFLLDELFDNAPVGILLFKPLYTDDAISDLIVLKANSIAGKVFNQLGLVGQSLKQFIPEFPEITARATQMLLEKQNFELYFKSLNKHLNMRTFPLENERFCMYVHDVTQYKNNISALQKSELRYSTLVEDSPALIRRFNTKGIISYVNSYYANYFNKTPEQLIGDNIFELQWQVEAKTYRQQLEKLSPSYPFIEYQQEIVFPDGSKRWQKWVDRALMDSTGNIVEYQSVGMDFSQLKMTEKSLEEQKNRLDAIFENSIMGIGVLDHKGNIRMANARLKEMFEFNNDKEGTNYNYFNFAIKEEISDAQSNLKKIFEHKILDNFNIQRKFLTKNGKEFWADIFASAIATADKKHTEAVGLVIDITQKYRMEQELKASEKKLKQLNNTKDKLFSVIAHDIRNPFNAILGFSTLLNKKIDEFGPREIREFTQKILEASGQTYKLLEDLLTWAKSQLGQLRVNKIAFNPHDIINDCFESLLPNAHSKNIQLQNKVLDQLNIEADIDMFKFVIRNLVHNGIKFSHPNSTVECGSIATDQPDTITIYVKDSGVGIQAEKLKILFNLDDFISTQGTLSEKGTGLGLSLSREMIELNGGTISVTSTINAGSEFRVTLPIR
ncbi:PAS domain-containing sensor histidine kinase [Saccharicrinis fermentans]|uniref:histidine kinase n=1 Tax=Saccharicrinis fermentans DSM 9555 = JCM 21142 TaxID=869213 RepID=W7Y9A8_9BACT|nr:PAS domain S-box protein [Saccharicrinis fermentans]GAF04917.1 cell-division control histidine kinase PdhS [Saccharicrinis fermentans DSM 9555 = JCM 21142]